MSLFLFFPHPYDHNYYCITYFYVELYNLISPEFSYRSGIMSSDSTASASGQNQGSGPPNRPLPPTPDDDAQGDRTLIMKRVSDFDKNLYMMSLFFRFFSY